ncbi:sulfite exporter TauE/SafE family protein [Aurantibacter crassamenti]|uniref:sulfite exporter TauE/SafE family protein n=1 Tax=Aurantibacter crassamenti TaxID=1837375 RepID=UPI001939F200|nr:sulfite exporter TauE/SafE family protein [Aurantibacter crassamenti]MBM1106681.1 sulfite exporter TauE/SafE family protein [Aurantibacter crassamenti]
MLISIENLILLCIGFFIVATLYSSVGFGGGSSYLAILTLVFVSFFAIRSTALICNLVVVSGSCYLFYKNGHLNFKKFLPFVLTSIPFAFIGARFRLQEHIFFIILGGALIVSALALILQSSNSIKSEEVNPNYPTYVTYILGAGIGLLSGLVGIGGGIFLAPILNYMKWDKSIKIAALASFFILVNSISGIVGLVTRGTFEIPWIEAIALIVAVLIGGQLGVRMSLNKFTGKSIKLITAVLVLIVGIRVLLINGLQINY